MRVGFQIKNPQIFLILSVLAIGLVVAFASKFSDYTVNYNASSEILEGKSLETKFAVLSRATSNNCGLQQTLVKTWDDDLRLQGSCCSPMSMHKYQEQIEGLKKYSYISEVPQDPYDISVAQAKQLFEFKNTISLTSEQEEIYNDAMKMSEEGGPCCCKCWHWDAYEGLAKYLIVNYGFNSEQIAEVWDLSDACGGEGHNNHT